MTAQFGPSALNTPANLVTIAEIQNLLAPHGFDILR